MKVTCCLEMVMILLKNEKNPNTIFPLHRPHSALIQAIFYESLGRASFDKGNITMEDLLMSFPFRFFPSLTCAIAHFRLSRFQHWSVKMIIIRNTFDIVSIRGHILRKVFASIKLFHLILFHDNIIVSSDRSSYSDAVLQDTNVLLSQTFTQSIDAIDVTSVTLSGLNSINAIDVTRYLGDILEIFWGHFWEILGIFWGYFEDILGIFWGYFGDILGIL